VIILFPTKTEIDAYQTHHLTHLVDADETIIATVLCSATMESFPSQLTILSFACFSLYFQLILTLGFDYQVLALPKTPEKCLRMRRGAPFKIALFADLHFGEDAWTDWGPRQDANSIKVMNTVLDDETPGNNITSISGGATHSFGVPQSFFLKKICYFFFHKFYTALPRKIEQKNFTPGKLPLCALKKILAASQYKLSGSATDFNDLS
jgi:hypothetical protein